MDTGFLVDAIASFFLLGIYIFFYPVLDFFLLIYFIFLTSVCLFFRQCSGKSACKTIRDDVYASPLLIDQITRRMDGSFFKQDCTETPFVLLLFFFLPSSPPQFTALPSRAVDVMISFRPVVVVEAAVLHSILGIGYGTLIFLSKIFECVGCLYKFPFLFFLVLESATEKSLADKRRCSKSPCTCYRLKGPTTKIVR